MRFARSSIAGPLGAVLAFAVGLGCLMFASSFWSRSVLSITMGLLTLEPPGLAYRRGECRAAWAGFALCARDYMVMSSGFWFTP